MNNGWITLHRKLKDSPIYKDSQAVHLWVHLLLSVNHKPGKHLVGNTMVFIPKGSLLTGRKSLAKATKIHESKITRLLMLFEKEQIIEQQAFTRYRLISITNWNQYQDSNSGRTAGEQRANTNNNHNNANNTPHTAFRIKIQPDFQPTNQTIEYAKARRLPDPINQQILDDFINTNLSSGWESKDWQSEYRKFLPKWKMRNEKHSKQSRKKLTAIERVREANELDSPSILDITPHCSVVGENDDDLRP